MLHNCIKCVTLFGSCRAVRESCASAGVARWIILPDDGSFSADTHVATQNTGIARTGSMLLRRRRGYVNWGVKRRAPRRLPPRRGSALPPTTRAPACCIVPCVRDLRGSSSGLRRDAKISLFTIEHDSKRERDEAQTRCNCVLRIHLFGEGENCTCSHIRGIHRNARSTISLLLSSRTLKDIETFSNRKHLLTFF